MADKEPELRLEIDPLNLDGEWRDQPLMRERWGVVVADCQFAFDEAKANLAVVEAELDRDIRDNPESYGLAKVTEAALSKVVLASDLHRKKVKEVNKARHSLQVAQAAVDGLEHRKRALTCLCELHVTDYYSTPKASSMPRGVKNRRRNGDDD